MKRLNDFVLTISYPKPWKYDNPLSYTISQTTFSVINVEVSCLSSTYYDRYPVY